MCMKMFFILNSKAVITQEEYKHELVKSALIWQLWDPGSSFSSDAFPGI